MAHFVKVNSQSIVEAVYVISNNEILDEDGNEDEATGVNFCKRLFGSGTYLQASFNTYGNTHYDSEGNEDSGTALRKNYPAIGYTYDSTKDAFIEPQPFASWILNNTTCLWMPPLTYPSDGKQYRWDETSYQNDNTTGWEVLSKP